MLKAINKKTLLAWLKNQVEDAHESLMEDMSNYVSQDWEIVNDRTPQKKLPLLINHDCEVVQLLARQRMKGKSIYDPDIQDELSKILQKEFDACGEKLEVAYAQGRLYQCAQMYADIGEETLAHQWKSWAWFEL